LRNCVGDESSKDRIGADNAPKSDVSQVPRKRGVAIYALAMIMQIENEPFMKRSDSRTSLCKSLGRFLCISVILGASAANGETKKEEEANIGMQAAVSAAQAQKYCGHIANVANEARNALQKKQLAELEQRVRQRLVELEEKKAELQVLIDRHEALLHRADDALRDVYSRMRPEAAAAQLANMDEETAISLLAQLRPKQASAIFNEMEPAHAATLVKKMSSFGSVARNEKKQ
jgi:flagellar motility protein MotE (MotC chaperone)